MHRRITTGTAAIGVALTLLIAPAAAQANDGPAGHIGVASVTFPGHTELRVAVDALPRAGWTNASIRYTIERKVGTHWKLAHVRTSWQNTWRTRPNGMFRDVQIWHLFQFHHTGTFRWHAKLTRYPGTQHTLTDWHFFRVT
jgi:hypothetical protein